MLNKLYFQVILASALVAAAAAIPAYEYGVNDDYSKANFKKTETQDASGNVAGSYIILHLTSDGRIQTTTNRKKRNVEVPVNHPHPPPYEDAPIYAPPTAPETTKLKRE